MALPKKYSAVVDGGDSPVLKIYGRFSQGEGRIMFGKANQLEMREATAKWYWEGRNSRVDLAQTPGSWDTCLALGKAVARAGMSFLRFLTLWLFLLTSLHPMDAGTQALY